jgi:hypothetical protein
MINLAAKITNAPHRTYIYWSESGRTFSEPATQMPLFAGKVEFADNQEHAIKRVHQVMRLKGYRVVAVVTDGKPMPIAELEALQGEGKP